MKFLISGRFNTGREDMQITVTPPRQHSGVVITGERVLLEFEDANGVLNCLSVPVEEWKAVGDFL